MVEREPGRCRRAVLGSGWLAAIIPRHGLARACRGLPAVMALSWALVPSPPALRPSGWPFGNEGVSPLFSRGEAPEVPALSSPPPPDGALPGDEHILLPDLRTAPPTSVEVTNLPTGRVLRFANTVWNGGGGAPGLPGVRRGR